VIAGRLGKVIRLPRHDIAHFQPSVIWSPEHATPFKAVQANSGMHVPTTGYQWCNAVTNLCSNDNQDQGKQQPDVYLVAAN
jgi:hypothetical protein